MIRPFAVALATGALCAALPAAGHAGAQEEGAPEPGMFRPPICELGEAMPEADLLAALEKAGFKLESAHAGAKGGVELTYTAHGDKNRGVWVRLLADGAAACALAGGKDEEISA